jgi:hypothetical protein
LILLIVAACGSEKNANQGDDDPTVDASPSIDAPPMGSSGAPGSACSCDADCAADAGHPGVCIYGVCMTKASSACASAGSQAGCPAGSRCWNLDGVAGGLCWPDCSAHSCAGSCDSDGSCAPGNDDDCNPTCGTACSCTATSCGTGKTCVNGECVPEVGAGPGPGPGPTCASLPTRDCTGTDCGSLVTFNPRTNTAWDDYPINGETATNQYRSYLRKDLMMLVAWATSRTYCKTAGWVGNGGALGLGDMSEANGAIPGTSIGSPGHPAGTHTNGYDIDLGYYQTGTANNRLREICPHTTNGQDQYHCTADPTYLDPWRHAFFLGSVFESTRTRVIGVDGKAGPILLSALSTLCTNGWLSGASCGSVALAYETTNTGQGWYQFHHHHSHISLKKVTFDGKVECAGGDDGAGCNPIVKSVPKRPAGIHRLTPSFGAQP